MKKIYLILLFVSIIATASGQNLKILDMDAQSVDTLVVNASSNDSLQIHLMVLNTDSRMMSVLVKKNEIHLQDGTENTFCWGTCYPPSTMLATNAVDIESGDTNRTGFYLDFYPLGSVGENLLSFTFFNEVDNTDSASIILKINIEKSDESTGVVESVEQNVKLYPNPVVNTLNIELGNFTNSRNSKLQIFNMIGEVVFERRGDLKPIMSIPLENLEKGIYFLNISDGNFKSTKKFIKQ